MLQGEAKKYLFLTNRQFKHKYICIFSYTTNERSKSYKRMFDLLSKDRMETTDWQSNLITFLPVVLLISQSAAAETSPVLGLVCW